MLIESGGELHHIDGVFADDFGEFGVGADEALILGVLEVVGFDVDPEGFGYCGPGEFFLAEEIGKGGGEFVGRLSDGFFLFGRFCGGFGGTFFAAAEAGLFDVGGFGVGGVVLFGELGGVVYDDVTVGVVGAGEEGFAKAGFAGGEVAVTADGGAGGEVFGVVDFFPFLGDVDDPFAVGVVLAAEEGAEAAVAKDHGAVAGGTGLFPVE